jgi:ketosteroid isomerase-like protein
MESHEFAHQAVLRVQEQFWAALQTKDATLLMTILAPAFIGRSPGEPDQTREAFAKTLLSFPGAISEISGEGMEVHSFGEIAILTGVQMARLRMPEGRVIGSRVMLTNVFAPQDQRWQMVLSHSFELRQDL